MSTPEFASAPFTVGQLNALVKIVGPDNIPGILDGTLKLAVKQPDLLKQVGSVTAGFAQRFVAAEHLKEANVGWTGDNFKKFFVGKVEENVPACRLVAHRLERASLDAPILAELGENAEVKLAHMFALIKDQANGETGILLTNGYANIFYVRDNNNGLWAVYACWYSCDRFWDVEAASVGHPGGWAAGRQVFSHDS